MKAAVVGSTIWAGAAAATCSTLPDDAPESVLLSDPPVIDLYVYRGDTGRMRVHITFPDGSPMDVSDATWDCDIRATEDTNPPIASLVVTPVDDATIDVALDAATSQILTNGLVWDLEMRLNGEVQTLMKGHVYVEKDVSRP